MQLTERDWRLKGFTKHFIFEKKHFPFILQAIHDTAGRVHNCFRPNGRSFVISHVSVPHFSHHTDNNDTTHRMRHRDNVNTHYQQSG